jgi:hypothetical protein
VDFQRRRRGFVAALYERRISICGGHRPPLQISDPGGLFEVLIFLQIIIYQAAFQLLRDKWSGGHYLFATVFWQYEHEN